MLTALLWAFLVGGLMCTAAQLIVDNSRLTPAQVLVLFIVLGVVASGVGLYGKLVDFAGAGATVPLPGFGYTLVQGIDQAVQQKGAWGLFTGGFTAAAGGVKAALVFGLAAALVFRSKA